MSEKPSYLRAIDFPVRFIENGNIVLTTDQKAINDTLKNTVFVRKNGIPLFPLGIGVQDISFDPADIVTRVWLSTKIRDGIIAGVTTVDPGDVVIEEPLGRESTLIVGVPYRNKITNERQTVLVPVEKVKTDQ